jgi:hypothetical protein
MREVILAINRGCPPKEAAALVLEACDYNKEEAVKESRSIMSCYEANKRAKFYWCEIVHLIEVSDIRKYSSRL